MTREEVINGLRTLADYFEKRSKHDRAEDKPRDIEWMNTVAEAAVLLMMEEDDGK